MTVTSGMDQPGRWPRLRSTWAGRNPAALPDCRPTRCISRIRCEDASPCYSIYEHFQRKMENMLFPDPGITRNLPTRDGTEIYSDGKRGLEIKREHPWMRSIRIRSLHSADRAGSPLRSRNRGAVCQSTRRLERAFPGSLHRSERQPTRGSAMCSAICFVGYRARIRSWRARAQFGTIAVSMERGWFPDMNVP